MTSGNRVPWRRVGAVLPAVALIGGGTALATTGGGSATDVVAESKPLITVPQAPLQRLEAPVLPPLPALPAPAIELAAHRDAPAPVALQTTGIPTQALEAYRRAAILVGQADSACRIDWALVAAIGKVESDHGRFAGNGLDTDGTVRPGIYGLPLNGSNNTARIPDSDGGTLDRDSTWDRAVGPMQFIPGTWRSAGVDANGDGSKDPQNIVDAATATAVYLCSGPGDLTNPSDLAAAVRRYNHSDAYVRQVVAIADSYRGGVTVLPTTSLNASQRYGRPHLPSGEPQALTGNDPRAASRPTAAPTAKPTPKRTAAAASGGTFASGGSGSGGSSGSGTSGSGTGGSRSQPQPSSTSGAVDTVTGAVTGAVAAVSGPVGGTATPTPTPTSTSTTTAPLPLTIAPVGGTCAAGYGLNTLRTLCVRL